MFDKWNEVELKMKCSIIKWKFVCVVSMNIWCILIDYYDVAIKNSGQNPFNTFQEPNINGIYD